MTDATRKARAYCGSNVGGHFGAFSADCSECCSRLALIESILAEGQMEQKALAWDEIATRLDEAHAVAREVGVRLGENVWHGLLDAVKRLKAAPLPAGTPPEPMNVPYWKCRHCGCGWRDNLDGTVSLLNAAQKSCAECEGSTPKACEVAWLRVEAAAPQGWQPISTAPKQMDSVLLWWPYWTQEPVVGARNYRIAKDDGPIEWFDSWSTEKWLGDDAEDPGPTHWMPLPDPPKEPQ